MVLETERTIANRLYKEARINLENAGEILNEAYSGYKNFLDENDFNGAKEYLRSMPDSPEKVLLFRSILISEESFKCLNQGI